MQKIKFLNVCHQLQIYPFLYNLGKVRQERDGVEVVQLIWANMGLLGRSKTTASFQQLGTVHVLKDNSTRCLMYGSKISRLPLSTLGDAGSLGEPNFIPLQILIS